MAEVMFLLGAGASKDAGLPLMAELTTRFRKNLEPNTESAELFEAALQAIGDSRNIEHVLSFLETLADIKEGSVGRVVAGWRQPFGADVDIADFQTLEQEIRQHIRDELSEADPRRGRYLTGLFDYVSQKEPADVFSLNYDMLVEGVCARNAVRFTTGFGDVWDPELFERSGWAIRIFKLHGSVDWYRLPSRGVVFQYQGAEPRHPGFPDEEAIDAVLYPAQGKTAYSEPFSTLLGYFNRALTTVPFCIVVGYSFGDEHILQAVLDHLAMRPRFQLIVADTNAKEIATRAFSDFQDRVTPLQLTAKRAFEDGEIRRRLDQIKALDGTVGRIVGLRAERMFREAASELLEGWERGRLDELPAKALRLLKLTRPGEFERSLLEQLHQRAQQPIGSAPTFLRSTSYWALSMYLHIDGIEKIRMMLEGRLQSYLKQFAEGVTLELSRERFGAWRWKSRENTQNVLERRRELIQRMAREYAVRPPTPIMLAGTRHEARFCALGEQLESLANLYAQLVESQARIVTYVRVHVLAPRTNKSGVLESLEALGSSGFHEQWWGDPDQTAQAANRPPPFMP